MATRSSRAAVIDGSAIALSSLCLIHCLLLPLMSAMLPIAGAWAEAEWLHRAFVIAALPFSLLALTSKQVGFMTASLIVSGLALLFTSAFVEALHDYETPLTVLGAILLAGGHIMRWSRAHDSSQS